MILAHLFNRVQLSRYLLGEYHGVIAQHPPYGIVLIDFSPENDTMQPTASACSS